MKVLTWFVIGILVLVVTAAACVGPGRFYGWSHAQEITGTVTRIQPYSAESTPSKTSFIIEVADQASTIYTFVSADERWGVTTKGDFLTLRLYPAPPWSGGGPAWRDARLLTKLSKLPPPPDPGSPSPGSPALAPGSDARAASNAEPPLPADAERYLVRTVHEGGDLKIYLLPPTPGTPGSGSPPAPTPQLLLVNPHITFGKPEWALLLVSLLGTWLILLRRNSRRPSEPEAAPLPPPLPSLDPLVASTAHLGSALENRR